MAPRDLPDWFGCYATPAPPLSDVGRVRTPRREQRERIANALAVVKAARKAGLSIAAADVLGVRLTFGQPEPAPAPAVGGGFNEWDIEFGTHPPEIRQ
jgi:hypothetical protein